MYSFVYTVLPRTVMCQDFRPTLSGVRKYTKVSVPKSRNTKRIFPKSRNILKLKNMGQFYEESQCYEVTYFLLAKKTEIMLKVTFYFLGSDQYLIFCCTAIHKR